MKSVSMLLFTLNQFSNDRFFFLWDDNWQIYIPCSTTGIAAKPPYLNPLMFSSTDLSSCSAHFPIYIQGLQWKKKLAKHFMHNLSDLLKILLHKEIRHISPSKEQQHDCIPVVNNQTLIHPLHILIEDLSSSCPTYQLKVHGAIST